jgi:diguanylate cyclase (GGDEF)-like protein
LKRDWVLQIANAQFVKCDASGKVKCLARVWRLVDRAALVVQKEQPIPSVLFHTSAIARRVIITAGVDVPPTVTRKLMSEGFALARVETLAGVRAFIAERLPVGLLMPFDDPDARPLVQWIREQERLAFVQIFVSPLPSSAVARAIREGIDDVFDAIGDDAADRMVARIHRANTLAELALLDPLTQLHNRRFMNDRLQAEVARAVRARTTFSLALIDLDDFKAINDTFGHAAGDRALAAFGAAVQRDLRAYDVVCRFGGDEFIVLFPDCNGASAQAALANVRARAGWGVAGLPLVTFSAGVAQYPDDGDEWPRLFDVADRRTFAAKRMGGNQTSIT